MSVLFMLFAFFGCSLAGLNDEDLDLLLQNVTKISKVSEPGPLIAFGPRAFSVIGAFAHGSSIPYNAVVLPVVAASRRDQGKIVVFGMDQYFLHAEYEIPLSKTNQLILNSCVWATRENTTTKRAAVHIKYASLANILYFNGFNVTLINEATFDTGAFVNQYDLVVTDLNIISSLQAANLDIFLRLGGGVVTGSTGWQENHEFYLTEWQGNNFLKRCGISFMGYATYTNPTSGPDFNASRVWVQDANSYQSWLTIKDHIVNGTPIDGGPARLTQLLEVVELAVMETKNGK